MLIIRSYERLPLLWFSCLGLFSFDSRIEYCVAVEWNRAEPWADDSSAGKACHVTIPASRRHRARDRAVRPMWQSKLCLRVIWKCMTGNGYWRTERCDVARNQHNMRIGPICCWLTGNLHDFIERDSVLVFHQWNMKVGIDLHLCRKSMDLYVNPWLGVWLGVTETY